MILNPRSLWKLCYLWMLRIRRIRVLYVCLANANPKSMYEKHTYIEMNGAARQHRHRPGPKSCNRAINPYMHGTHSPSPQPEWSPE